MPENPTDEQLAVAAGAGNREAYEELIRRFYEKLMRYARKFLARYEDREDLLQEVFLKVYRHINSFDPKYKFSSWIYRIAHNEFINFIKKRGREPIEFVDFDVFFPHARAQTDQAAEFDGKLDLENLNDCLNKLPPKYREVLVLNYFENLSYQEISEILRVPVSTVGVRIKRGKEKLKIICREKLT